MRVVTKRPFIPTEEDLARGGPYDGVSAAPWFLPDEADGAEDLPPLPRADRRRLIDPAAWAAAQAALAAELADLAWLHGRLEARLSAGPPGWRHRLALIEAAEMSWAVGDRIPAERLALWQALRLSGVQEDSLALARAAWALRRLLGPEVGPDGGLAGFFGRQGGQEALAEIVMLRGELSGLHPVVQAVALGQGWRIIGPEGPSGQIEALVLAGRLAGSGWGAGFVPQAAARVGGGPAQDHLARWLAGAAGATRAALAHLDRLSAWQARAGAALQDKQGRTAGRLVAALAEWPLVTAPMAQALTGASTASVLRNLSLMAERGLLREVTGQGRYRVWTAAL